MIHQLADSKEQAEILAATALQPLDVNADGTQSVARRLTVTVCLRACNDLMRNFSCLVEYLAFCSLSSLFSNDKLIINSNSKQKLQQTMYLNLPREPNEVIRHLR